MIAVNSTFFDLVAIFGKVLNSSQTGEDICQIVDNPIDSQTLVQTLNQP